MYKKVRRTITSMMNWRRAFARRQPKGLRSSSPSVGTAEVRQSNGRATISALPKEMPCEQLSTTREVLRRVSMPYMCTRTGRSSQPTPGSRRMSPKSVWPRTATSAPAVRLTTADLTTVVVLFARGTVTCQCLRYFSVFGEVNSDIRRFLFRLSSILRYTYFTKLSIIL
uniref:Uncharacterized protein n=1 Tax=Branchiostoma floridae TaxID=7739 RepID=C3YG72_BRAFL|eukprot:XP_002604582.1 hypothetical protein BRAFLDRAFT_126752 [Branchiostoma floridae]